MGLILCERLNINHPLYVDALSVRLHSLEELCYVIYQYPMLVLDDFVDDRLLDFLENELKMGMTAVQLRKHHQEGYSNADILVAILDYSDYYSSAEIDKYKSKIIAIKKLPKQQYLKQKADFMFSLKRYGKAVKYYESAKIECESNPKEVQLLANILNNIGCCYSNMFAFEKSFYAYKASYELIPDKDVLKNIYFLSLTDPVIAHREYYQQYIDTEVPAAWEKEYQEAVNKAKADEKLDKINEYFSKDSVKKNRQITTQINSWKKEYRNMI